MRIFIDAMTIEANLFWLTLKKWFFATKEYKHWRRLWKK